MSDRRMISATSVRLAQAKAHRKETALWLSGGMAAACFACTLTAINGKMQGLAATTALRLFTVAIPTLTFNMIVAKDRPSRYYFGWLTSLIPATGVVAGGLGISAFLYAYEPACGVIFGVIALALVWLMITAEDAALKRRQGRRAAESLHLEASKKVVPLKV